MVALASAFVLNGSGTRSPRGVDLGRPSLDRGQRCSHGRAVLVLDQSCDSDRQTTSSSGSHCGPDTRYDRSHNIRPAQPTSARSLRASGRIGRGCIFGCTAGACPVRSAAAYVAMLGSADCTGPAQQACLRTRPRRTPWRGSAVVTQQSDRRHDSTCDSASGTTPWPTGGGCTRQPCTVVSGQVRPRAARSSGYESRPIPGRRSGGPGWRGPCSNPDSGADGRSLRRNILCSAWLNTSRGFHHGCSC